MPELPEGTVRVQKIIPLRCTTVRQGSLITIRVVVAPASLAALKDLAIQWDPAVLEYKGIVCSAGKNNVALYLTFLAVGKPTNTTRVSYASLTRASARSRTYLTVVPQPVSAVRVAPASQTLVAKDTLQLTATVLPDTATNKAVRWTSSNRKVATVSSAGLVTAVKAGTASIYATSVSGGKKARCKITVTPAPKYRALLVDEDILELAGTARNDLSQLREMLKRSTVRGEGYDGHIQSLENPTKAAILSAVGVLAADKRYGANDVTLFYFAGEGVSGATEADSGIYDADSYNLVSIQELREALDAIPGPVVVILDANASGKFIGKGTASSSPKAFNQRAVNAFAVSAKGLDAPDYHVITSCTGLGSSTYFQEAPDTSWRRTFTTSACAAGGYDFRNASLTAFPCDVDLDGIGSLQELAEAAKTYKGTAATISIDSQCYPASSSFPVLGRS
jgi:hypothetical protein